MKPSPYKSMLSLLFFIGFIQTQAFCKVAEALPLDSAVNNLAVLPFVFPQEKMYVQTDKPYYISGEKIFFRAYLLDTSLHHPVYLSRYIYVELIKQESDSACVRVQIRPKDNVFSGHIQLPEDLAQGHYRLRAYTRYMTNLDEDFFFTRSIYIANPRHDETKNKDKPASAASPHFDVSFYPEGGHLVDGNTSAVAFKALSSAGESIPIEGELYDSQNNLLSRFTTHHDGMGVVYLLPRAGERYHAVCYYKKKQIKINLPEVQSNTVALKTSWRQNKLWINVNKADGFAPPRLYLVIHTRGELIHAGEWDWEKGVVFLNKTELPSGISHILLLTEEYQTVSERLVFVLNDDQATTAVVSDKSNYATREKVRVDFRLSDPLPADSLLGSFSVSVFDDRDICPDSVSNILSTILLTSDLKGSIHNPVFYLQKDDKTAESAVDLLMMTHGWTRYDIPKILRGDYQYPEILPEQSQVISGIVKSGLLSKPYADAKLTIASSDGTFFEMGEADEFGKFAYYMELPDSTVYLLKALNKKDKKGMIELCVDEAGYPDVNSKSMQWNKIPKENVSENISDYVAKADAKYVQEKGMRQIDLSEVVVRGKRAENKYRSAFSSPTFDFCLTEDELKKLRLNSIQGLFYSLQGVRFTGSKISIQSNPHPPLILIDDAPINPGMTQEETMMVLKTINVHDIAQVSVIKGARANIFGPEGANGVIEMFTKRGELTPGSKSSFNIKKLSPLGYQKPVEFYSPQYETPEAKTNETPDLRSLIYWKPDVFIDSEGKASFEFYTADTPSTYTVVIEGVTSSGRLIYLQARQLVSVDI